MSFDTELDALIHRYTRQEYLHTADYELALYVLHCLGALKHVLRSKLLQPPAGPAPGGEVQP